MPAPSEYILVGGPCDGNTGQILSDTATNGVACKGILYKPASPTKIENGRVEYTVAGKVRSDSGSPPSAAHAEHGWRDLKRAVHDQWPSAMRGAEKNRQAALRTLAHARRVKH